MQLKINRLSYQKLCVHNTVEIKCDEKHIGYYDISTTYKILEDNLLQMLYSDRFITKLSNIYGIKKKYIQMKLKSSDDITFENTSYPGTKIVFEVEFNDPIWFIKYNRDLKIRQLLN
jgi:abortive infection bacteriophage resistance protein